MAGLLVTRFWRRPTALLPTGVGVWLGTVAIGMILRGVLAGQGTAFAFILVALAFLGLFQLGWLGCSGSASRQPGGAPGRPPDPVGPLTPPHGPTPLFCQLTLTFEFTYVSDYYQERWAGGAGVATAGERGTDEALKAIAEPRRRAILRLVADEELAAGEIAAAFEVTRTAVSQHLTVLKQAGLLTERRDGTRRLYRARPEGLAGLREFLTEMWASSLDAARQIVEAERGISDDEHAASAV